MNNTAPPPAGTPGKPGRHRRRRRGKGGGDGGAPAPVRPGGNGPKGEPPRGDRPPQKQGRPPRPALPREPVVPQVSKLVTAAADDRPLGPDEVVEMKRHLEFLRTYRAVLRIQYNATEDLLVNGQREPSDRGVCRHLLAKLDRAAVDAALAREPVKSDPQARSRLLGAAVRVTGDVGVLISYLESLVPLRSRDEAAQAFRDVVQRIDFAGLSGARLARLLGVLLEIFTGPQRTQVVLGLLANEAFRTALDAAQLPPDVATAVAPLRTLEAAASGASSAPADVTEGLRAVMALPAAALQQLPERVRIRMVDLATGGRVPNDVADGVAAAVLPGLPKAGRDYSRLAMRRASQWLERKDDKQARATLEALRAAQPDYRVPAKWLAALDLPRVGRVAIERAAAERSRLAVGWWLDRQRDVVVRAVAAGEGARLAAEVRLQRGLCLPGVAAVVLDASSEAAPYVAVVAPGQPVVRGHLPREGAPLLALLGSMARVLRALALAGVRLPDVAVERFLVVQGTPPLVTLADLDGATAASPDEAAAQMGRAAWALATELAGAACPKSPEPPGTNVLCDLAAALEEASFRATRQDR